MRILAVISGEYGKRHVENIIARGPEDWSINIWQAPSAFPMMIDYPEDYLPESFEPADLILAFGEHKSIPELIPDIAQMCVAKAVIAPIDHTATLPPGLARQLHEWLGRIGVSCATPKPLCSLTEKDYMVNRRQKVTYDDPLIAEFARYFGKPSFKIEVDSKTNVITSAEVIRDAVCGCASYTAERLEGVHVDEAEHKAGMLHHHFPCLASMGIDPDFGDTLMHVSGNIIKDEVAEQVRPYRSIQYFNPGNRSD
jgi:thymidylate synthase